MPALICPLQSVEVANHQRKDRRADTCGAQTDAPELRVLSRDDKLELSLSLLFLSLRDLSAALHILTDILGLCLDAAHGQPEIQLHNRTPRLVWLGGALNRANSAI